MSLTLAPSPESAAAPTDAEQYAALFLRMAHREAHRFGELIASREDHQLLGATEFDLRALVHQLGAAFLEAALNERKKGGTAGQARSVPAACRTPG